MGWVERSATRKKRSRINKVCSGSRLTRPLSSCIPIPEPSGHPEQNQAQRDEHGRQRALLQGIHECRVCCHNLANGSWATVYYGKERIGIPHIILEEQDTLVENYGKSTHNRGYTSEKEQLLHTPPFMSLYVCYSEIIYTISTRA